MGGSAELEHDDENAIFEISVIFFGFGLAFFGLGLTIAFGFGVVAFVCGIAGITSGRFFASVVAVIFFVELIFVFVRVFAVVAKSLKLFFLVDEVGEVVQNCGNVGIIATDEMIEVWAIVAFADFFIAAVALEVFALVAVAGILAGFAVVFAVAGATGTLDLDEQLVIGLDGDLLEELADKLTGALETEDRDPGTDQIIAEVRGN